MNYIRISQILCMFGFLKEFRPGEPFVTDYIVYWKNITSEKVTEDIYPVGTYSYCATLILIFLLTDFLRYKPIIILSGLSGIITYITLTFGTSVTAMQIVQFTYGLYLSTDVAYYTYIYAKVDKKHYQTVSSYTRSAFLCGRCFASTVAQLIVSFQFLNYHQLNYFTLGGQGLATIWALFLPSVKQSVYFHRLGKPENEILDSTVSNSSQQTIDVTKIVSSCNSDINCNYDSRSLMKKIQNAYYLLWKDFVKAYTSLHVIKWSLWWAAATCGYLQVLSYSQPVWQTAVGKDDIIYNGAVEALYSIIGAAAVFGIGKLRLNWDFLGEAVLSAFTFIEAILLYFVAYNYNIWMLYTLYIIFGVIFHTIVTVASFEVAKKISEDSYGLVFGINTLLSLIFQSILTYVVTSGKVFKLKIREQFIVYAWYFAVLAVLFTLMALYTITNTLRRGGNSKILMENEKSVIKSSCHRKIDQNSS